MKNDTELIEQLYGLLAQPMKYDEIRAACKGAGKEQVKNALDALLQSGRVMKNKKNRYAQSAHYGCMTGTFLDTERAFAFVAPDEDPDGEGDLFIPPNAGGGAWQGDRVLVRISPRKNRRGRREGTVLRVLSRAPGEISGTLQKHGRKFTLRPRSKKYPEIAVDARSIGEAQPGDCVSVAVTFYGNDKTGPQGEMRAAFGQSGTMAASVAAVLHENGIHEEFPADVQAQADAVPQQVPPADTADRLDLRDRLIFTIDGDDARDFDDAVSLEPLPSGRLLLGVHIADVSHYVTPGSPLDSEAYTRGTSVYYPGHVVPMLPFTLSHGICSLNPDVDRLCFSAMMEMDPDGTRHKTTFSRSVIRSKARMTYHNVNLILDGDKALCEQYAFLKDTVLSMNRLAHTLTDKRCRRGALELDIPEAEIRVDETGEPVEVTYRERGQAERLIEEFMLLANESVAEYMCKRDEPTVYRVHEDPDPEKLRVFAQFAKPFGYRVNPEKPKDTAQLQAVLDGARGDARQRVLPMLLLRSLARARYADTCIGHYGLQAKYYLHFTSPIRRYPDLMVHRSLAQSLSGEPFTAADRTRCTDAAAQSTTREQAADTAERDIDKLFLARYMHQFIGQEFDGEVSGVQSFGLFIALENGVEGLVRTEELSGDYFVYDESKMALVGRRNGMRYTIGTPLRVLLTAASDVTGQIDFVPAGEGKGTTVCPD